MPKLKDLAGQRFGFLTVKHQSDKRTNDGCVCWVCRCDCGGYTTAKGYHLTKGETKSCGCLQKSMATEQLSRFRPVATCEPERRYSEKSDRLLDTKAMRMGLAYAPARHDPWEQSAAFDPIPHGELG
ncbi:MAG: hypothetical protein NVS3B25_09740 [Hymenobacter sp.]